MTYVRTFFCFFLLLLIPCTGIAKKKHHTVGAKTSVSKKATANVRSKRSARSAKKHAGGKVRKQLYGRWKNVVPDIEQQYAPDKHTSVFHVVAYPTKDGIVLSGEVDRIAAKEAVLSAMQNNNTRPILDDITLLPDSALGGDTCGIINVSVADLRSRPGEEEELASQLLAGSTVRILKKSDHYLLVQCPDRFIGWIRGSSLLRTDFAVKRKWESTEKVLVTDYYDIVREQPFASSPAVANVVCGCLLKKGTSANGWTAVEFPDHRKGFLPDSLIQDESSWKNSRKQTPDAIEATAKSFFGIPYLWGGSSIAGFDCSGFTQTVFRLNGIDLYRDASQQAAEGTSLESNNLSQIKRGDLVFFSATPERSEHPRIIHVGIYLGNKLFIHELGRVR